MADFAAVWTVFRVETVLLMPQISAAFYQLPRGQGGCTNRGDLRRTSTFTLCDTIRYDTKASGNWYKADEPWGAYLQTDGNPAVSVHPYESDPSSGSFNPQAHTTWVPVDWNSWPNYNVHGYGVY